MRKIKVRVGAHCFVARLETELAPRTCAYFSSLLPYREKLIHARWSGEGCWIPLGDLNPGLHFENPTSYPAPGQFIFYPGGFSETELLLAYGSVRFASKVGQLAGNHFLSIIEGMDELAALGRKVLWEGAQEIAFESGDPLP